MFKSLAYEAMVFAREKHKHQVRKYTGEPYPNHLAEVVAISMSVGWQASMIHPDKVMAVAWLHDVIEDCGVLWIDISSKFGNDIADGVMKLSDNELDTSNETGKTETGNVEDLQSQQIKVSDANYKDIPSRYLLFP